MNASSTKPMGVLAREEESENEVRREDQDRINEFAKLNARKHEIRSERESIQRTLEGLDDAGTELMMMEGGGEDNEEDNGSSPGILVWIGEAFFEVTEEEATAHCETLVEKFQSQLDGLASEQETIQNRQNELKTILYGRFGKSINLEDEPQSS